MINFAKINENNGAVIPSKNQEDAGYDVYACFDKEEIKIEPNEMKLISTGIASAFSDEYYFQLKERGSTGVKCMAVRAGVMDSGFRGEWKVPINNTGEKTIVIDKFIEDGYEDDYTIYYPYKKAICQAVLIPVPKEDIQELTYEELCSIESERGTGMLGDSGK